MKQGLARACRVLLARIGLERLWTEDGPTPEASSLLEVHGAALSPGQRIAFLAAWTFWDGAAAPQLAAIPDQFEAEPRKHCAS